MTATDRRRARWALEHAGHDTYASGRFQRCHTCERGDLDVDPAAVLRAMSGFPPDEMSIAERLAAVAICARRGLSAAETAERIGASQRNVVRDRGTLLELGAAWLDRVLDPARAA